MIFIVKATAAKEQEALQLAADEAQATNQQMQTEIDELRSQNRSLDYKDMMAKKQQREQAHAKQQQLMRSFFKPAGPPHLSDHIRPRGQPEELDNGYSGTELKWTFGQHVSAIEDVIIEKAGKDNPLKQYQVCICHAHVQ